MKMTSLILVTLIASATVLACGKKEKPTTPAASAPAASAPAASAPASAASK